MTEQSNATNDTPNWKLLVSLLRDPRCMGRHDLMADAAKMIERLVGHVDQFQAASACMPSAIRSSWIAPADKLPFHGELIVFMVASGAVFLGCYSTIRDYPKFSREDGHGDYTPKAVTGWMELPK